MIKDPTRHDLAEHESRHPVPGGVKRAGLVGAVLGMLALDWAALHDITAGLEASYFLEWLVLGVSVPVVAVLLKQVFHRNTDAT